MAGSRGPLRRPPATLHSMSPNRGAGRGGGQGGGRELLLIDFDMASTGPAGADLGFLALTVGPALHSTFVVFVLSLFCF
eukprot:SAG11_NODE_2519_length_3263_cov_5.689001_3_plen_79_part_00